MEFNQQSTENEHKEQLNRKICRNQHEVNEQITVKPNRTEKQSIQSAYCV